MSRILATCCALTLSACCIQLPPARPTPVPDDPAHTGTPAWPDGTLTLGTTDDSQLVFLPIGEGIDLHRGPQGGEHVYNVYRVTGPAALSATFDGRVRRQRDGLLVSRSSRTWDVDPGDAGMWTSDAVTMFLCPTSAGVNIVGEPLALEVTVTQGDGGLLGRANATAVLHCTGCEADCGG